MRIKLLYLWIVLMSIAACSREDVQHPAIIDEDQYAVSLEEALEQLEIFLSEMSSDTKSTQSDKAYSLDNILTVKKDDVFTSTKAKSLSMSLPDDLMYVVNFDNNSGTAVLSADRRTEDIVLCVTDSGEITLNDFNADNDDEDYVIVDMGELIVPSLLMSGVLSSIDNYDYSSSIGYVGTKALSSATNMALMLKPSGVKEK